MIPLRASRFAALASAAKVAQGLALPSPSFLFAGTASALAERSSAKRAHRHRAELWRETMTKGHSCPPRFALAAPVLPARVAQGLALPSLPVWSGDPIVTDATLRIAERLHRRCCAEGEAVRSSCRIFIHALACRPPQTRAESCTSRDRSRLHVMRWVREESRRLPAWDWEGAERPCPALTPPGGA